MIGRPRVVLVSGCSRAEGLGFEVCRQLAQQGATVILTARDREKARALAHSLRTQDLDVVDHELDISSDESVQNVVEFIRRNYGRLDVLVNNATGATRNRAGASTADLVAARQVIDVTLFGTWRMIQAALPLLRESRSARIVNVSSSAGLHSDTELGLTSKWGAPPAYSIGKTALNALTVKFATELRDTNIKVNAVCPGFTATFPTFSALGARPVSEGAEVVVWAATLNEDGPSGGFYRDKELQGW